MFVRNSQCKSQQFIFVDVCVPWSWVHYENLNMGHNNLTKLNDQTSSIWLRFMIEELLILVFF
jgi:hypothetical protein